MSFYKWNKCLLKGTFAEVICVAHFKSAGWIVSETGIQRIVPAFAGRDRRLDKANDELIHKHIGYLPDLLVQKEEEPSYFVEIKFNKSIKDIDMARKFLIEQIWKYRNYIFGEFDSAIFTKISHDEWHMSGSNVRDHVQNSV